MTVATKKRALLWLGPHALPGNVAAALGDNWDVLPCASVEELTGRLRDAQVVMIAPEYRDLLDPCRLSHILDQVELSPTVGIVLVPAGLDAFGPLGQRRGQFILADADAPPGELAARIETVADLQPAIKRLRADLAGGPETGGGLEAIEEEMRLAASLQRDFLPRPLPEVESIRFAALYRPASWVSGDFYDVFRLDETHVGFYVADVAGHGLPAALLTMFIKKALQTKRIVGSNYEIVPPQAALTQLNTDICEQDLSSCHFCTAVYAVADTAAARLDYARGGHPCPLLLRADGRVQSLTGTGPLLGIFPDETFEGRSVELAPGDRVVLFSDGAEAALASTAHPGLEGLAHELQRLRQAPADEMVVQLTASINERHAPERADDVTVLVMDVTGT